jgi:preprotein translocase subunit SecD
MQIQPSFNSAAGYNRVTVPSETKLSGTPSTKPAKDAPPEYVMLPSLANAPYLAARYVLGPSEMTSASIAHATAYKDRMGQWVVDYTMTPAGSRLWDKVAEENFHRMLGVDLNGVIFTAPIIQPTHTSFTSFDGRGELAGGFSKALALELARAMNSKVRGHS